MAVWQCNSCLHEWEARKASPCDWCGTDTPQRLEPETNFEAWVGALWERLLDWLDAE